MYTQAAIKSNTLLRNGAYGIVMRGVQKCTRGCSSLRGRKRLPLCCIKLDTATDPAFGSGGFFFYSAWFNQDALRVCFHMPAASRKRCTDTCFHEIHEQAYSQ